MPDRFDDVIEFRFSLNDESDRGCALMAAAYLDIELDRVLRASVVQNEKVAAEVFGQARAVSSFSSRIDLAYLLGLISDAARHDMHLIRKIRNEFGHVHRPLTFSEPAIQQRCTHFKLQFRPLDQPPRSLFITAAVASLAELHGALHRRQPIEARDAPDLDAAKARAATLDAEVKRRVVAVKEKRAPDSVNALLEQIGELALKTPLDAEEIQRLMALMERKVISAEDP